MKKIIIISIIAVGILSLGLAGFIYRNVNKKPAVVVDQTVTSQPTQTTPTENAVASKIISTGGFVKVDSIHEGKGNASIVETSEGPVLEFDENFNVTNGPDLLVYLSPNTNSEPLGEFASLGELKSISGKQTYKLPANYKDYKSVNIWCRAFDVKFTHANLVSL